MTTRRLIIRPQAKTDVEEAAEWYEARRAGLGSGFLRDTRLLWTS